jgi:hypothetical protein
MNQPIIALISSSLTLCTPKPYRKWSCYIITDTPRSLKLRHGGVTNERQKTTQAIHKGV